MRGSTLHHEPILRPPAPMGRGAREPCTPMPDASQCPHGMVHEWDYPDLPPPYRVLGGCIHPPRPPPGSDSCERGPPVQSLGAACISIRGALVLVLPACASALNRGDAKALQREGGARAVATEPFATDVIVGVDLDARSKVEPFMLHGVEVRSAPHSLKLDSIDVLARVPRPGAPERPSRVAIAAKASIGVGDPGSLEHASSPRREDQATAESTDADDRRDGRKSRSDFRTGWRRRESNPGPKTSHSRVYVRIRRIESLRVAPAERLSPSLFTCLLSPRAR